LSKKTSVYQKKPTSIKRGLCIWNGTIDVFELFTFHIHRPLLINVGFFWHTEVSFDNWCLWAIYVSLLSVVPALKNIIYVKRDLCTSKETYMYIKRDLCMSKETCVCEQNGSSICVTCLIHVCDVAHSCVWRDSFVCVTYLIHVCDVTHSCV